MSDPAAATDSSKQDEAVRHDDVGDTRLSEARYASLDAWLKEKFPGQLQPTEPVKTPAVVPPEETPETPEETPTDTEKLELEIKQLREQLKKRDDTRRSELLAMFNKKDQTRYAQHSIEALEAIIEDREVTPRQRGIGRPPEPAGEQKPKEPGRLGKYDIKKQSWSK